LPSLVALPAPHTHNSHLRRIQVDFLNALKPLKKLRKLDFDHPWVTPRETPFHRPDGRTIRSVQARELSPSILADPALEGKVRDLIRASASLLPASLDLDLRNPHADRLAPPRSASLRLVLPPLAHLSPRSTPQLPTCVPSTPSTRAASAHLRGPTRPSTRWGGTAFA